MTHSYISGGALGRQLRRLGLTALLAGGTALAAQAQAGYSAASSTNAAGTYTDLGSTGTVITTPDFDDSNSAAQNIGFSFSFSGNSFTQFVLNTNGYIKLGSTAPTAPYFYASPVVTTGGPMQSTTDNNLILPFNTDLVAGATSPTEYRVNTTGTSPNRVCTIQWKNVSDKASTIATQYANLSFQVKLYEGTNSIEFVYGTATAGVAATATYRTVAVGLKSDNSSTNLLTVQKASATVWSSAIIQNGDYPVQTGTNAPTGHNVRATVLPDAGRTYRFNVAVANDAAVSTIYTLGKIATPSSLPHTVRALVRNVGTAALTNLVVTLAVTGANTINNTQTIASLAVGASTTVTFAAYPSSLALGTNNITVSVPADGNSANNSQTYTQQVTTNRVLVADPALTNAGAVSYGAANGTLAAKFTISAATRLTDAVITFSTGSTATTAYQVVVYDATGTGGIPGAVLYTSPTQNRPAAGGAVTVTLPNTQVPANFFIGVKEIGATGALISSQPETPLRTGVFYASADGATGWFDVATSTLQVRFLIEAGITAPLATSKELLRAVTIYPNPSATGIFNLDIHNANAKGLLGVEVVNQLGQRVYTGSAHDNLVNSVDLSNLAPGLYHLQVRNGEDFLSRQISIVK